MPEAITLKQHQVVRRVLETLRRGRPLRDVASRESELRLRFLAEIKPTETRKILQNILFLHYQEGAPKALSVPEDLYQPYNRKILNRMGNDLNFLASLIDREGRLSLRPEGFKAEAGYVDHTLQFRDYQLIKNSSEVFLGIPKETLAKDHQLATTALINCMREIYEGITIATDLKGIALAKDDVVSLATARATLIYASRTLKEIHDHLPPRTFLEIRRQLYTEWSEGKLGLIQLLDWGNNVAAGPKAEKVLSIIEAKLRAVESKLFQQRASRRRKTSITEDILDIVRRKQGISIDAGGLHTIPQSGFRKREGVVVRDKVQPQTPEDKVLRRTDHIIEGITKELRESISLRRLLERRKLECFGQKIDPASLLNELARIQERFKEVQVDSKKGVRSKLLCAMRKLFRAKQQGQEEKIVRRLVREAGSELNQAVKYLDERLMELGSQLSSMHLKREIEQLIIEIRVDQDRRYLNFSKEIIRDLQDDRYFWKPSTMKALRADVALAIEELGDPIELGMQRLKDRLQRMTVVIGALQKLLIGKYRAEDSYRKLKENYRAAKALIDAGRTVEPGITTLEQLNAQYYEKVREFLRNLAERNYSIKEKRIELMCLAELIKYDIENKYEDADIEKIAEQLAGIEADLLYITDRDSNYVMATAKDGTVLEKVLLRDARKLDLKH
jgi:hypothetical protein